MQDFKKLRVWRLAQDIALRVIEALPERSGRRVPGLRNQAIRAAMSVAANIAEGCGRATRAELLHFLEIALGSHNELRSLLCLARDAGVLPADRYAALQPDLERVHRMLISLMRTLQRRIAEDEESRRNADASPRRR
jgi:four helix bundle protein